MEIGINTDPIDEYSQLANDVARPRTKKRKNSRKSSLNQSINKLKSQLLSKKFTLSSILIKFYTILLSQHLFSFFLCIIGFKKPLYFSSQTAFISCFFVCVSLSFIAFFWKHPYRKTPSNYILLVIFTACYMYSIAYLSISTEGGTLMMSVFTTLVIVAMLLIYVSVSEEKYNSFSAGLIVIVAGIFHYYFFNYYASMHQTRTMISLCWLIMWGMYLIFWTWKIIKKEDSIKKNDFILCSFRFYIVILFILSMVFATKERLKEILNIN